ncbi:MAG: esterase-like activity of phytase family protein [Synechococcales cyanobacterium RU_4_20]|nr:esterase-like activity of phytase family protein [Synechococcales cyanobacterium RU_4_20]
MFRRLLGFSLLLLLWGAPAWQQQAIAAPDRRFIQNLQVEWINEFILPAQTFESTTVGGLSAITYDRKTGKFYALSDQHGSGQAHFYTLNLEITDAGITSAQIEAVTYLSDAAGNRYGGAFDPEGMALTPQGSLYVSSEGNPEQSLGPGLTEFDLKTGQQLRSLPIPEHFQPAENQGVQANRGFESLTLGLGGTASSEPLHVFTATEGPLLQDKTANSVNATPRNRFLHYYRDGGDDSQPLVLGEYVYELDPAPGALIHGLSEILALDGNGHFLGLERAFSPLVFQVKLFQFSLAGASDVSSRPALQGNLRGVEPIHKQLVMDLSRLDKLRLDNLEGMTWGPQLADGSRSLILISDDNFKSFEKTQLLLFKVRLS